MNRNKEEVMKNKKPILSNIFNLSWYRSLLGQVIKIYLWKFGQMTMGAETERMVEYPWVLANLYPNSGAKILDIGCSTSVFALQLASLGYLTYGLDVVDEENKYIRDYREGIKNFIFVQGDARKMPFKDNYFDRIIAVSTIEHIDEDELVIREIGRTLKKDGKCLITFPYGCGKFGKRYLSWPYRIYDNKKITEGFKNSGLFIKNKSFFLKSGKNWLLSDEKTTSKLNSSLEVKAVICLEVEKKLIS